MSIEELMFPTGIRLLRRWQEGNAAATKRLREIMEATARGEHDDAFKVRAPTDAVHISGSIDLLTLGMINDLFGLNTAEFYKDDPHRYVRSVMMTLKLMGMPKTYLSWPVYGFTAEALGQEMIYSEKYSPGTNPDVALIDASNWHELTTPDFSSGMPRLLDDYLAAYRDITGFAPVLHLSAPYSLAADIYGQEHLINALTHEPEMVDAMLDHLADVVLKPWIEHFLDRHPDGWIEFSDASGSPFFIGPRNCANVAIRPIKRLKDDNVWGDRLYIANYRGDYVTKASPRRVSSRRRSSGAAETNQVSLDDLFASKHAVCRDYVIRLADDRLPTKLYVDWAIDKRVPLFVGIGATEIDRNSVGDVGQAKLALKATATDHVESIKNVAEAIGAYNPSRQPPWPGTVYFEDVSAESNFELIEVLVGTALNEGKFALTG